MSENVSRDGDASAAPPKAADLREMQLPDVSATPAYAFPLFRRLSDLFGPKLPEDITYEAVQPANAALVATEPFTCSYDEGFGGHFTVPNGGGAAARFDLVMSTPHPLAFIRQHLRCAPRAGPATAAARGAAPAAADPDSAPEPAADPAKIADGASADADPAADSIAHPVADALGGGAAHAEELIIFSPGLNTLHMLQSGWEGESTTPQRLQRYVDILQRPMAQLHIGTDMDQGPAPLLKLPWLARMFLRVNAPIFRRLGFTPPVTDGHIMLSPPNRDYLEALLSAMGYARPLFQAHMLRLLEFNETAQQPLVLMPYSRSTGELSSALRSFVDGAVKRHIAQHGRASARHARERAEEHLWKTLTVVSVGNIDRRWTDGPAYIHLSALCDRQEGRGTDPMTANLGVSERRQTFAGRDAVFLHFDGVYAGGDAHNFGTSGAPALRMAMKLNGVDTLRGLWEKGREGPLEVPTAEQMRAAVVVTGADEWLWDRGGAYEGVTLPEVDEAEQLLEGVW
eukprot:jgi/Ulvmu1/2491/UM137_0017.1